MRAHRGAQAKEKGEEREARAAHRGVEEKP